jgi:[ribosomal protein S5]-alanine N-acetyltransferase
MNSQINTEINTSRLHLRTLTESDVAIVRLINGDEFKTDEAATEYIRWINDPGRLLVNFYIWLTQTGQCIGRVYIHSKPELCGEVEIGYGILKEHRNKGYATEAAKAAVKFAFEQAAQEVLCAIVKPENIASHRVIEKLGFKNYGVRTVPDEYSKDCKFDYFKLLRTK